MKQQLLIALTLMAGCSEHNKENKPITVNTSLDFKKAEASFYDGNDSAYYYLNDIVKSSKDSLQIAMAHNYMAQLEMATGDYYDSQERLLESLRYLQEDNRYHFYCLSSDYNILGNNCQNLKNYKEAIDYYNQALKFAYTDELKVYTLNNKGVAYQKLQAYGEAIAIYQSIFAQYKPDKKEYARVLSNLAKAKWLQNPRYPAVTELWTAMQMRQQIQDNWGLNASYSHLSDYYADSRPDSALLYADKMLAVAKKNNNPDDQLEALQKLISLGRPEAVKKYAIRYQYLNDSIQTARNNAKNQFALIRYETEKSKSDYLVLQKDNAEKKIQIIQQRIVLYGTILLALTAAVIATLWYKKRKQQLKLERENAIQETQLKLSKKVHDVVANGLYRIMAGLEHREQFDKKELTDKIEVLYEQSRDISYDQPTSLSSDFQLEISRLLTSFATPATKILIVGNDKELWKNIAAGLQKELIHVLQELMINMKKHSQAKNVLTRFERQGNQVSIQYQDDGVGLPADFKKGNGLTNTENRIQEMHGRIIFDRNTTTGMKMRVTFPII